MQFVADGPDIPTSLRAQREGSLIFVVGAGVSRTAGLPLFGGLVDQVYAQLGQALPGAPGSLASRAEEDARKAGQYDRLIGLLEQRLVYRRSDWRQPRNSVREAVAAPSNPGAEPHSPRTPICWIFRGDRMGDRESQPPISIRSSSASGIDKAASGFRAAHAIPFQL